MIRFEPAKPTTQKPTPCFRSIADRMAETMREMAFSGETVTAESLGARGFSDPVIKRFCAEAAAMARRRSVRVVEH